MSSAKLVRGAASMWFALLVAALLSGCNSEGTGAEEFPRPATVPVDAKFVGGLDGGVFLLVKSLGANTYQVKVYLDSGFLAYEGPARASPADNQELTVDDVVGWDGEQLQLTAGGSLIPTEPIKPIEADE